MFYVTNTLVLLPLSFLDQTLLFRVKTEKPTLNIKTTIKPVQKQEPVCIESIYKDKVF